MAPSKSNYWWTLAIDKLEIDKYKCGNVHTDVTSQTLQRKILEALQVKGGDF